MTLPHNRFALASLAAALVTVISFCGGLAPIPMTAVFCYPLAVITGITALVTGFRALRQIREINQPGRWMALAGIGLGLLTILAVVCATTITALLVYYGAGYFETLDWGF